MRPALVVAAFLGSVSLACAEELPPLPSTAQIIEQVAKDYESATSEEAIHSIEMWCRDALASVNFDRDNYLLTRAFNSPSGEYSWDLIGIVTSLKKLDQAEADLLCPRGAIP